MHLTARNPDFVIRALLYAPARERRMPNPMWWGYQDQIERLSRADDVIAFELHPFWQVSLLIFNTWVIVGLIGFLFGWGFWTAIGWGVLTMLALLYVSAGVLIARALDRDISGGR